MAGTVSSESGSSGGITLVTLAWTSHASNGTVGSNPVTVPVGQLVAVNFVPGTSGDQPTDNYDVTLVDSYGFDVLGGAGANRSNAAAQQITPNTWLLPSATAGRTASLDLTIAAAGNTKKGTVLLAIRRG